MRQITVDRARRRNAARRGSGAAHLTLSAVADDQGWTLDVLALDEAVTLLDQVNERAAHVVMLRTFGGMTIEEVSQAMALSPGTIKEGLALRTGLCGESVERTRRKRGLRRPFNPRISRISCVPWGFGLALAVVAPTGQTIVRCDGTEVAVASIELRKGTRGRRGCAVLVFAPAANPSQAGEATGGGAGGDDIDPDFGIRVGICVGVGIGVGVCV
jgi:hypothetical protein